MTGATVHDLAGYGWLNKYWPACGLLAYWWDGEYEGNCELREDHPPGIHCDGLSWYNDDTETIFLDEETERYIWSVYGPPVKP